MSIRAESVRNPANSAGNVNQEDVKTNAIPPPLWMLGHDDRGRRTESCALPSLQCEGGSSEVFARLHLDERRQAVTIRDQVNLTLGRSYSPSEYDPAFLDQRGHDSALCGYAARL